MLLIFRSLGVFLALAISILRGGGAVSQPSFEQFFSAIAEQESGGRYSALGVMTGGDRAYGKYQVMGANIPSWTATYYGKRLSPQQYLNSPAAQDAVARGVLKSYYNKYGARGAASAWYSGNPNLDQSTRSQYGGPSVKGYVDSVINKAYRYSSSGGSTPASSSSGIPEEAKKPMTAAESAEEYGFVQALLNSNSELKEKFAEAVKSTWSPQRFQAELRDTNWWKSHSKTERDYLTKRYGDPATAKAESSAAYVKVRQLANQLGMRETPGNKARLNTWAYNVVAKGWSDDQLRYDIGKYVYFDHDVHQGQGGEEQDKLRSYAYNMGVTMSSQWYADKSRNIIRGVAAEEDYKDEIRRQAKATYSEWATQIDAGKTIADLASPYMQSMSQILEIPSGSINPFDPDIKKALQYKDPQTGETKVKPLWQFENDLRGEQRWKKTKNAQDSMMQVAHQVLSDFGVKY